MDLVIKRDTVVEEVDSSYENFIGPDGVYKNIILSSQDKIGDKDFNKGEKFINLRVEFEDGRTKWLNVKYKDADKEVKGTLIEGNYVQSGVNFVTALRDILVKMYEEEGRPTTKFNEINGSLIIKEFIDKEIPIYLSYYNSEKEDKKYFNLSMFFSPVGTYEEAEAKADERDQKVIQVKSKKSNDLDKAKTKTEEPEEWDEDDEEYEDEDEM